MKKILIFLTTIFILSSCSTIPNIKTSSDNPKIPFNIIQLADSQKDSLKNDTTNVVLYKSFCDKTYQYDYKITNKKVEFIKMIILEDDPTPLLIFPLVLLFIGIFIGYSIFTD